MPASIPFEVPGTSIRATISLPDVPVTVTLNEGPGQEEVVLQPFLSTFEGLSSLLENLQPIKGDIQTRIAIAKTVGRILSEMGFPVLNA